MSQKSSVPQAVSFVSQVLKRDTGDLNGLGIFCIAPPLLNTTDLSHHEVLEHEISLTTGKRRSASGTSRRGGQPFPVRVRL